MIVSTEQAMLEKAQHNPKPAKYSLYLVVPNDCTLQEKSILAIPILQALARGEKVYYNEVHWRTIGYLQYLPNLSAGSTYYVLRAPVVRYCNMYSGNKVGSMHKTLDIAKRFKDRGAQETIRMVQDMSYVDNGCSGSCVCGNDCLHVDTHA